MIILFLLLFVLGLVIGSFLNVLIYRTVHGEDFVHGRSKCPHCKHTIFWYDNIPLISFLVLGGKCRNCKTKISWRYPAIELLSGLLFVWWFFVGFTFFRLSQAPLDVIQPLFWLSVGLMLLIIFATDWLYQIIPDYANLILGVLAVGYRTYLALTGAMRWEDFVMTLLTGFILSGFLFLLWWFTKGRGMGFGDVKYALVMGILLGWPRALVGIFLAFISGALAGLILILSGYKKMREKIAFGPFLVLGTLLALIWGSKLWDWYIHMI